MKEDKLLQAMTDLDDDLILEAEAGEQRRRKILSRPLKMGLIAAALVLALGVTAGAVHVVKNWDAMFVDRYAPSDEMKTVLDDAMQDAGVSETRDGITYTVKQIMGDEHSCLMTLDIHLPEDMVIPEYDVQELRELAEKNGYDWTEDPNTKDPYPWSAADMLERLYDFDMAAEAVSGSIYLYGASLVTADVSQEELEAAAETDELVNADLGEMPSSAYRMAGYHTLLDQLAEEKGVDTDGGERQISQHFDPETNTLSLLLQFYQDDGAMAGQDCTLMLMNLYVEDLMETYSYPRDSEEGEQARRMFGYENLLEEPLLIHFTTDYTPYSAEYNVYCGGETEPIGTMDASPLCLYFRFDREFADVAYTSLEDAAIGRGQKNIIYDQFGKALPVIRLKDGTEIQTEPSNAGLAEFEYAYFIPEDLFRLEDVAEIVLKTEENTFQIVPVADSAE